MPKIHGGVQVRCPFYKNWERTAIQCEGIAPRASLRITFGEKDDLTAFFRIRCCRDWESCRIAQMLIDKWEDFNGTK